MNEINAKEPSMDSCMAFAEGTHEWCKLVTENMRRHIDKIIIPFPKPDTPTGSTTVKCG